LHANDFGDLQRSQEVLRSDVAQPDTGDEAVLTGLDKGRELVVEAGVGWRTVDQAQIGGSELVYLEGGQVVLEAATKLVGFVVEQDLARVTASSS
jgi:hypothetical protein